MNQIVPNGSMKESAYSRATPTVPSSAAMPGALKMNWMVSHRT